MSRCWRLWLVSWGLVLLVGCQSAQPLLSGPELYQRLNCWACHERRELAAVAAPDLREAGRRLAPAALEEQLLTPRRRRADSRMPSFAFLRPEEIRELMAYLAELPPSR